MLKNLIEFGLLINGRNFKEGQIRSDFHFFRDITIVWQVNSSSLNKIKKEIWENLVTLEPQFCIYSLGHDVEGAQKTAASGKFYFWGREPAVYRQASSLPAVTPSLSEKIDCFLTGQLTSRACLLVCVAV